MVHRFKLAPALVAALALGLIAVLATPFGALAAYPPGPYPGPGPAGSFQDIVVSRTVGPSGATITADSGSATISLSVPEDASRQETQLTVYAGNQSLVSPLLPSGTTFIHAFAVTSRPLLSASSALRLTISDTKIPLDAAVFQVTGTTLVPAASATVSAGRASVTFARDAAFVIARYAAGVRRSVTLTDTIAAGVNRGTTGFATRSLSVAQGADVTYLVRTSRVLAGRSVQLWVRSRNGAWKRMASRVVASDGTAHFYLRIKGWTAIRATFVGDASYLPAVSHARIATTR
jgi:hypothetical protein